MCQIPPRALFSFGAMGEGERGGGGGGLSVLSPPLNGSGPLGDGEGEERGLMLLCLIEGGILHLRYKQLLCRKIFLDS